MIENPVNVITGFGLPSEPEDLKQIRKLSEQVPLSNPLEDKLYETKSEQYNKYLVESFRQARSINPNKVKKKKLAKEKRKKARKSRR